MFDLSLKIILISQKYNLTLTFLRTIFLMGDGKISILMKRIFWENEKFSRKRVENFVEIVPGKLRVLNALNYKKEISTYFRVRLG